MQNCLYSLSVFEYTFLRLKCGLLLLLIQATKAASDAWKLMSPDEKAKYTTRAREVWDKYLSATPARTPKPRRQVAPFFFVLFWCSFFLRIFIFKKRKKKENEGRNLCGADQACYKVLPWPFTECITASNS